MYEEYGIRKALIISVSDYKDNNLQHLDFCKNNGEEMYSLLKDLGYEIPDNNTLIGEVKWDKLRQTIINFFADQSVNAKDTLLFYFSGHGVPDQYGDTYISTSEIDPDAPYRRGFSFNELTRMMNRSTSRRIVSILDCCYSGAPKITKGSEDEAAKLAAASMNKISKILQQGEGKCLLAASLGTQEAYGLKGKDHSLFTYHLLEGLRGANGRSIDSEGCVTPESLGSYVYDKVTEKYVKQKPIIKTESAGKIILAIHPHLGIAPSPSASGKRVIDIGLIIYKGEQCVKEEDYENAIKLFDDAIKLNPTNLIPYHHKGDVLFKLEKYEEAIKCYDEAISANPGDAVAYNHKGDVLFKLEKYKEAIECYDKALEINPNYFDVLKDKGLALDNLGMHRKAIQCYDTALEINPQIARNWYYKALTLSKLSNSEESIRCYDEVLRLEPNNIDAWIGRGICLGILKRYKEAIECYDKAITIDPNNAAAYEKEKKKITLQIVSETTKSQPQQQQQLPAIRPISSPSSRQSLPSPKQPPPRDSHQPVATKDTSLEKYPYATFPEKVIFGKVAPLKIVIKAVQPIPIKDTPLAQGIGAIKITASNDEIKIITSHGKKEEVVPIRVYVEQNDFEVDGGIYYNTILVPVRDKDSDPIMFDLKSKKEGEKEIIIQFFQQGMYIGELKLNTLVLPKEHGTFRNKISKMMKSGKVAVYSSVIQQPKQPSTSNDVPQTTWNILNIPPRPDITLYIYEKKRYPEYEYVIWLTSAEYDYKNIGSKTLTHKAESRIRALFNDIENRNLPADIFDSRLKAKGRSLYNELFSDELKRYYWQNRDRIKSFQIITKDPWIPWEIIRPYDMDTGKEDPFLCESYAFSRWIEGKKTVIPNQLLKRVMVAVPDNIDLVSSIEERNWIEQFGKSIGVEVTRDSKYRHVISALKKEEFDILHFSTHGKYNKKQPLLSHIELEDGLTLRPEDIGGEMAVKIRQAKPVVILNTCQSGVHGFSLSGIQGWATQFLDAGASAFIGTLWRVSDKAAFKFTQELYKQLSAGVVLGEAVQKARTFCKEPGDSSWLAYELYGQPNSPIKLGSR